MENNLWIALLLTTISGLSTGLGGLIVVLYGKPSQKGLGHLLSFSSGVMIFISFMDLLPGAIAEVGYFTANCWLFIGMILFAAVERYIPEPDSVDLMYLFRLQKSHYPSGKPTDADLLKAGIVTAVGISLHNFPEGIAVYLTTLKGLKVGLPLAFAIAAHNVPEGMAVAAPIYGSTRSKWEAVKWSTLSGACEPVGAVLFGMFFTRFLTSYVVQCSLALVAGIMIFLCLKELIPVTLKYLEPREAMVSSIAGMFLIFLSVYFMNQMLI